MVFYLFGHAWLRRLRLATNYDTIYFIVSIDFHVLLITSHIIHILIEHNWKIATLRWFDKSMCFFSVHWSNFMADNRGNREASSTYPHTIDYSSLNMDRLLSSGANAGKHDQFLKWWQKVFSLKSLNIRRNFSFSVAIEFRVWSLSL